MRPARGNQEADSIIIKLAAFSRERRAKKEPTASLPRRAGTARIRGNDPRGGKAIAIIMKLKIRGGKHETNR